MKDKVNIKESEIIKHWKSGFRNISVEESTEAYPYLIENAEKHIKIAKHLTKINEYGNAVSHCVLASEEAIKGLIIYAESKEFDLKENVSGINRFFTEHKIRHELAKYIQLLQSLAILFIAIIQIVNNKLIKEVREEKKVENLKKKKLELDPDEMPKEELDFIEWWNKADYLKQRGFYVGYYKQVLSPMEITKCDYSNALHITTNFLKNINYLITKIESFNESELAYLRTEIKKDEGFLKGLELLTQKKR